MLLVAVPGAARLRWAAEQWLDVHGWPMARSPGDADLLVECGTPGPQLAERVAVAWDGLPGPRGRGRLAEHDEAAVAAVLLAARARLRDLPAHVAEARERPPPTTVEDADPNGSDMSGMDHGGMDMSLPGGLTMADRVVDRDGLRLEGLQLRLGPLLPAWPTGLELAVTLSGDVLQEVTARRLDDAAEPAASPAVLALDNLALLLEASGWTDGALRARLARAEGGSGARTADLLRRIRRARLLRWSLRGLPGPRGRSLVEHLEHLARVVETGAETGPGPTPAADLSELEQALVGMELGSAALVLAAYGPTPSRKTSDV